MAHAEHFAHRDDFAVGCYASYHSMDGLFVVTRIKENFNQSWTALCDANQMKSEEEAAAAATLLQEIRRRNFNAILQPGAMRWFNHCTVYFSVGVDCLVSHLKHTVSLCLCVYALLNSTEFTWIEPNQTKPNRISSCIPTRYTTKPIHKYSVAIFSFHQFITDRAVIWMELFRSSW